MDAIAQLLDILKYVLPALIVLIATAIIINRFLFSDAQKARLELFKSTSDATLRLRLQAYERLVMLIERISFRQLLSRVYDPQMTVFDFQQILTSNIAAEFEHNLSQQIYVSRNVWETTRGVKEQQINMVNQIARGMDAAAPAKELYTLILSAIGQSDAPLPTDIALAVINEEAKQVLSSGG